MKKRIGILSITVFTFIFLFTVISCEDPWSLFYLPDYEQIADIDPTPLEIVNIVVNDRPETGQSIATDYSGSEATYQWYFNGTPISHSAGGSNAVFYPSEPGVYKVIVIPYGRNSIVSNEIVVGGESIPQLAGIVKIKGSGMIGDELTASYSGTEIGESIVFYSWYRNGVPLPLPAPPAANDKITPALSGVYTASARVAGYNPKPSNPITVSDTGGLPISISISPPNPIMGPASTVTANINPQIHDPIYEWIDPYGASVGTNSPTSPVLDEEGVWTIRVKDQDGRTREYKFAVVPGSTVNTLTGSAVIKGTGRIGEPLTAEYSGSEGPVSFQWFKDGVSIPAPLGTGITIPSPTSGTYVVRASVPGFSPKPSAPAHVGADGGLGLSIDLIPLYPLLGIITSTTVDAALVPSTPNIVYEWFNADGDSVGNGTPIPLNPNGSRSPTLNMIGNWNVIATDPATGRVRERPFTVTLGTLAGNFNIVGSGKPNEPLTATYTHGPNQSGPITYEWLLDGNPLSPPVIETGLTSTITPTPTQLGDYTVRISVPNFYPRNSDPVMVTVTNTGGLLGDITLKHEITGVGTIAFNPDITPRAGTRVEATYNSTPEETGPFTYEWFNPAGVPSGTGQLSPTLTAGPWTIKATGPAPNLRTIERTVVVAPSPTGTITIKGSGKPNDTLTAEYSGSGSSYQWLRETSSGSNIYEPILGATSANFSPTQNGKHIVQITTPGSAALTSSPAVDVSSTGGLAGTSSVTLSSPRSFRKTATLNFSYTPGPSTDATPNFTYTWIDPTGARPASGPVASITNVTSPRLEPEGDWIVRVTDSNGRVRDLPFTVTRPNLNNISNIAITGSGRIDEPLTAVYTHGTGQGQDNDPIYYEWFRNGTSVAPPSTNGQLMPTLEGNYTVRVSVEGYGPMTSSPVIPVKSTGGLQTGSVTVTPLPAGVGDTVTAVHPDLTGTYQWQRLVSGSWTNVGTTNSLETTDRGEHRLIFTQSTTNRVLEVLFTVLGKLEGNITVSGTGKTGDGLTASYSGTEGTPTFQWYRDGQPVPEHLGGNNQNFTPSNPGDYTLEINIPGYAPERWTGGSGGYGIRVSNLGGLSGSFNVTGNRQTGSTVTASWASSDGSLGPFSFEWFRPLADRSAAVILTPGTGMSVANTRSLIAAGWWTVVVTEAVTGRTYQYVFEVIPTFHMINFSTMGGQPFIMFPIQNIEYGEIISAPTPPTKAGYNFVGWFTSTTWATQFDFTGPVTTNMNLFARWEFDGSLSVGDIGPGGGRVFYVDPVGFNIDPTTRAHYLEVASSNVGTHSWDAVTIVSVTGTDSAIGTGLTNTTNIINARGANALAAQQARDYVDSGDGLDDWFLPSRNELNQLYSVRGVVGLPDGIYWSSTQENAGNAYTNQATSSSKTTEHLVRPIRAF